MKQEILSDFEDKGVYCVKDIIQRFSFYFHEDFWEMVEFFQKCPFAEKKTILKDVEEKNSQYSAKMVSKIYRFFERRIEFYQNCGLEYLILLSYLKNLDNGQAYSNLEIEKELERYHLFHFGSILVGKDVKKILLSLDEINRQLREDILKINSIDTYSISTFELIRYEKLNRNSILLVDSNLSNKEKRKTKKSLIFKS